MTLNGGKIRGLCRRKGLCLKDLLGQAGVSRTAYYALLRKETILPRSLRVLAARLGVSPLALLTEEGRKERFTRRYALKLNELMKRDPSLDRDIAWHTLLLLREKPLERLRRGILRAQKFNFYR